MIGLAILKSEAATKKLFKIPPSWFIKKGIKNLFLVTKPLPSSNLIIHLMIELKFFDQKNEFTKAFLVFKIKLKIR